MNKFLIGVILMLTSLVSAHAEDNLTYNPTTGDYTLTYGDNSYVIVPGTKIDPQIQSLFEINGDDMVSYRYRVHNHKNAKQNIDAFRLMLPAALSATTSIGNPNGWRSLPVPSIPAIVWSVRNLHNGTASIAPGKSVERFTISARYLPGMGTAELWHHIPPVHFQDEDELGPNLSPADSQQFDELMNHNYVSRYTANPAIAIPSPFDPVAVLTAIRSHLNKDLINMNLITPALAASLDQTLLTAIQDVPAGNMSVVRRDVEKARHLLKAARPDLEKDIEGSDKNNHDKDDPVIDKLASRVLDFDLKYIQKRLGRND